MSCAFRTVISSRLFGFADELVRASVDLIAVVGAVTARAARKATRDIPIVYAVVVDPVSDGLANVSGQPLGNMTGMTTYDPDQARMHIALLRSVKPDLAQIALLADSAVSDCLVQANISILRKRLGFGHRSSESPDSDPDLIGAFAAMQRTGRRCARGPRTSGKWGERRTHSRTCLGATACRPG